MVVMNIPHDKFELDQHVNQLKTMIENAIPEDLVPFDFEMKALHLIEHTGLISEQIELVNELMAIKKSIGQTPPSHHISVKQQRICTATCR